MSSTSRFLEETFRPSLLALEGIQIRLTNHPIPADAASADAPRTPAIVISAQKKGDWLAMKIGDQIGEMQDLKFTCRVAANAASSVETLDSLAASARQKIETASGITGWRFLQITPLAGTSGFDGDTRTFTLNYEVHCLQ